jgi:hypothetical protein
MENLIKEDVTRMLSIMGVQPLNEAYYQECSRFFGDKEKLQVCKRIASLKSWLHKDDGLGMKTIINDKLTDLKTDVPDNLKEKFINAANLLEKLGKITERQKNNFINNRVIGAKLIYVDVEWQPANKLNTNYSDLAELITDLLYRGGDNARPFIDGIMVEPKSGLLSLKKYLPRLVGRYFEDSKELLGYTKNIQRSSDIGEVAENEVKSKLEDMGFVSEYSGGNGDLIDMVFGTDLIMSRDDVGTKTIQVKNSEWAWDRNESYNNVDWVIIANPFTIYDNKTKQKVEL